MSTTDIATLASYFVDSGTRRNGLAPAILAITHLFEVEVAKDGRRWGWVIRFGGVNVMSEPHVDDYRDDYAFSSPHVTTKTAAAAYDILADGWVRHCIAQFFAGNACDLRYGGTRFANQTAAFAAAILPVVAK